MSSVSVSPSRARLYELLDSFEHDMRNLYQIYILTVIEEEQALGDLFQKALDRQRRDDRATQGLTLVQYLDMREAYDLLNRHRQYLPSDLARNIRESTVLMDDLVAIRNRVMHPRPLVAGDHERVINILKDFQGPYWKQLTEAAARLDSDQSWIPGVALKPDPSSTLHNLPLPEHDETGLIGREIAIAEVTQQLLRRREHVITVTGEGGIGKTALALQVAYGLVDHPDRPYDAVLWTSLKTEQLTVNGIKDVAGAVRELAGATAPIGQVLDGSFDGTVEDLAEVLDGLNVLLVLDNLETVGGVEFLRLYDALPTTVTFLLTSRVGVGEVERRYPLPPLDLKSSKRLLNELVKARNVLTLQRISDTARTGIVTALRGSALGIHWFVLSVESGNDPIPLLHDQRNLLEFCVRSVYSALPGSSVKILTTLSAIGRSLLPDELVVLSELSVEDMNDGLQELTRGALVRREPISVPGEIRMRVTLTETATQFLSQIEPPAPDWARTVTARDRRMREKYEQSQGEILSNSLAPYLIHTRGTHDISTAQMLQSALSSSRHDYDAALQIVSKARRLNPEFWEVDRVEGFIRAYAGDLTGATSCYLSGYEKSEGADRGIVAHFFAGHLSRNMQDSRAAMPYAREAHELLQSPDTAVSLGNVLMRINEFEEAIELIESSYTTAKGRARLIGLDSLVSGYRRWAEHVRDQDKDIGLQFEYAVRGFKVGAASVEAGIVDEKLLGSTNVAAAVALDALATSVRSKMPQPPRTNSLMESLSSAAPLLSMGREWTPVSRRVHSIARILNAPTAVRKFASRLSEQEERSETSFSNAESPRRLGNLARTPSNRYGFIKHGDFPTNLFFHSSDMTVPSSFDGLIEGDAVTFEVVQTDRGPRGVAVEVAGNDGPDDNGL